MDDSMMGDESNNMMPQFGNQHNYIQEKETCIQFLQSFQSHLDENGHYKYMEMLREVANRQRTRIPISLDDIESFDDGDILAQNIELNTLRYMKMFASAVQDILPPPSIEINAADDVLEVLRNHRLAQQDPEDLNSLQNVFPPDLMRRFEIGFVPHAKTPPRSIRQVKASDVGGLVKIKAIITRMSDVKPLMSVATYTCESCGHELYQEVKSRQFTPVSECTSAQCRTDRVSGRVSLQTKASKFVKFQEVKAQELPDQVPMGHIPRTLTIYLRGELTRTCEPGAILTVSGMFLPLPFSAYHQMRAGLLTETYLEATEVMSHKKRYSDMEVSEELEREVRKLSQRKDLYAILSKSIAPEIFGHEDVKKALLLLMIGGVTKRMDEGMKIRGDMHVCLMGDPGVAKSQLLKHIASIAPRGVYTTGKGSSGVGLTAAVVRDTMTKEMTLEGGALVLADMGICAIDEFDKMDESDRTAIHEVMEQQTVSIAKAGITTTLNARSSILAAANPRWGRYNLKYSPSENIDLPNALLSRFDLMFLILDHANLELDAQLARHVTYVHRYCTNPEMEFEPVAPTVLRYFVAIAKQFTPCIPPHLTSYIVEAYVSLRQEDAREAAKYLAETSSSRRSQGGSAGNTAMTARQLLSILRMSQALAKLRFSQTVEQDDVDEAMRLVYVSKSSLLKSNEEDALNHSVGSGRSDVSSKIYRLILDHGDDGGVEYTAIEPIVLRKGFTVTQLRRCIDEYQQMEVLQLSGNGTYIYFISS